MAHSLADRIANISPASVRVFTTVVTRGPVSRTDVARRTGLSAPAVTRAAQPLLEAGYLVETGDTVRTGPGAGRPANPLNVRADHEYFAGVKITETELIGVITDLRAQIRAAVRTPLAARTPTGVVTGVAELVDQLLDRHPDHRSRLNCLGLALPGDIDRATGTARYSPFLDWHDVPLADLAQRATGLAVSVENDVKALTTAEQWFGHGLGARSFVLLTIGAGIGCAVVSEHRLVTGAFGVAGEIGHVCVDLDGPPCRCGGRGCVEAIASHRAVLDRARAVTGTPGLSLPQAVERARAGDPDLRAVLTRAGQALGLALATVANLVGPERIVVSCCETLESFELIADQAWATFERQAYGAAGNCRLITRALPFEEWARGAAAVSIGALFTPTGG